MVLLLLLLLLLLRIAMSYDVSEHGGSLYKSVASPSPCTPVQAKSPVVVLAHSLLFSCSPVLISPRSSRHLSWLCVIDRATSEPIEPPLAAPLGPGHVFDICASKRATTGSETLRIPYAHIQLDCSSRCVRSVSSDSFCCCPCKPTALQGRLPVMAAQQPA